jgi:hypothetical protein
MAAAIARGTSDACIVAWPSPLSAAALPKRCDRGTVSRYERQATRSSHVLVKTYVAEVLTFAVNCSTALLTAADRMDSNMSKSW